MANIQKLSKARLAALVKGDDHSDIFDAGVNQGKLEMRKKALTFLEHEYVDGDFDIGSDIGKAILELTSRLSAHLRA